MLVYVFVSISGRDLCVESAFLLIMFWLNNNLRFLLYAYSCHDFFSIYAIIYEL